MSVVLQTSRRNTIHSSSGLDSREALLLMRLPKEPLKHWDKGSDSWGDAGPCRLGTATLRNPRCWGHQTVDQNLSQRIVGKRGSAKVSSGFDTGSKVSSL